MARCCSPETTTVRAEFGTLRRESWCAPSAGTNAKILAAHFLADGRTLVTGAAERNVAVCDYTTGKVDETRLLVHEHPITSMSVSADGQHVLTASDDGKVRLWNLERREVVRTLNASEVDASENDDEARLVRKIDLSQDGHLAVTVNPNAKTVRIWDLETGKEIPFAINEITQGPFIQMSDRAILWAATFAPDGRRVVTVGGDQARLWDLDADEVQSQRERMSFSPHGAVASASFSTSGQRIVSRQPGRVRPGSGTLRPARRWQNCLVIAAQSIAPYSHRTLIRGTF